MQNTQKQMSKRKTEKMRLKKDFLSHKSSDETILLPVGGNSFSGIVKGNKTFGAIVDLLKEETTRDQIVTKMKERFEAPEGAIEKDVDRAIAELRKIGAIESWRLKGLKAEDWRPKNKNKRMDRDIKWLFP